MDHRSEDQDSLDFGLHEHNIAVILDVTILENRSVYVLIDRGQLNLL